ncbi:E3 ubiquitin- ligase Nedd-4 isoform X1 [Brachionus plicatilis]|uniref:E3 ubiquitin-ligase Nedd-4 isoform X1 n=1 Tax=Brachionus plicatilis TaxID=10195 RepID=A0A3M7P5H7_BRAPC|nr:E3 ubiquitin- ligase Nedd-4 isoform X1 [Brachionus plicatilis]
MEISIYDDNADSWSSLKYIDWTLMNKIERFVLFSSDLFGSIDPFVEIFLCKKNNESVIEFLKTPTIKKNSNPVYNIDFIFNVIPSEHKLIFDIKSFAC